MQDTTQQVQDRNDQLPDDLDALDSPDKEVVRIAMKTVKGVLALLEEASHLVTLDLQKADRAITSWEKTSKYSKKKAAYEQSVRTKSQLATMETRRKKLIGERDDIREAITDAKKASESKVNIRKSRTELLNALQQIRSEYYSERKEQADLITVRADQKLRLNVREQGDNTRYRENLLKLKVKSYAGEKEIDSIITNLPVIEFVEAVLDRDSARVANAASISEAKAESLIDILLQPDTLSATLALQHDSFPEDQIEILYRKQDGSYRPLPELSMGQKADALLMIALGDSQMPVVIDQPEDALDLSSIWDDICQRLRVSKHSRQFLFTTHNSSVAVASDSDQFIIMEADATRGWIAESGSIDETAIKKRVLEHLEGGPKSYHLKRKKYNE